MRLSKGLHSFVFDILTKDMCCFSFFLNCLTASFSPTHLFFMKTLDFKNVATISACLQFLLQYLYWISRAVITLHENC